jgi:hypothetical protein
MGGGGRGRARRGDHALSAADLARQYEQEKEVFYVGDAFTGALRFDTAFSISMP